ncbi:TIGR02530 family flagellar biosynthesis protein [Metasolibacillus meyeri]|uniref:TIGR02530 family flagellar biosynthesis protein n=2 Tax=Metasolibacillus meyeri TaxID=1071052 RepID=A0AAW9NVA9_9BACL|nr:TIGR02530 family flagellar biosynthesis protein [Metasolibacillus meyeri]MEC1179349.1 TIGR02530 family flagellar biosynthesis protein [Metasolibacillus meyeri]
MKQMNSIQRIPYHPPFQPTKQVKQATTASFMEQLQVAVSKQQLKVSKHAIERLQERNITISDEEWQQITDIVSEAHEKGVRQPLVLIEQAALIVNAKNATVITAMDRLEAKAQIFTNIDGTIIL